MLSRVANSIFWMSRYTERAENVARFIDVTLNLTIDMGFDRQLQWEPLIYTTGDHELFFERYPVANQENVIRFLTFDDENPNSIMSCLQQARENARTTREMISSQMWEELNKFYLLVRDARNDSRAIASPFEFFGRIKQAGYLLEGVTYGTMSHGEAWNFGRLGTLIERADKTSRILDVKFYLLLPGVELVGTPLDISQWGTLLKSASALEMYRKRFGRLSPKHVVQFLLLDRNFPRAVRFCIIRAEQSLLNITGGTPGNFNNRPEQLLGRLRSELDYMHIDDIMSVGLHESIDDLQLQLNTVGEAISDTFFALTPQLAAS
ncbi:alpha-E domain-containing protein [Pirellulaceae bacterium SH467]